jgi:Fe-S-cluster containining protein
MLDTLITDPSDVERLAEERSDENWGFRTFLKGLDWPDRRLDAVVHEISADVTARIDCTACANCCKVLGCALVDGEIERLARLLQIDKVEFGERYVTVDGNGNKAINAQPCPLLAGNLCSVYEDRPEDCQGYPHLHKPGFRRRLFGVMQNASVCPIVYNTLERLKDCLGWRRPVRR